FDFHWAEARELATLKVVEGRRLLAERERAAKRGMKLPLAPFDEVPRDLGREGRRLKLTRQLAIGRRAVESIAGNRQDEREDGRVPAALIRRALAACHDAPLEVRKRRQGG